MILSGQLLYIPFFLSLYFFHFWLPPLLYFSPSNLFFLHLCPFSSCIQPSFLSCYDLFISFLNLSSSLPFYLTFHSLSPSFILFLFLYYLLPSILPFYPLTFNSPFPFFSSSISPSIHPLFLSTLLSILHFPLSSFFLFLYFSFYPFSFPFYLTFYSSFPSFFLFLFLYFLLPFIFPSILSFFSLSSLSVILTWYICKRGQQ